MTVDNITASGSSSLLNPDVFDALSRLTLNVRTAVEGLQGGIHPSATFGSSVEFSEHTRYYPGDDLRNVDWKVFGRTDRYFIKRHEKEVQLSCLMLLDSSASMGYRGSRTKFSKHEFAKILLGTMGHLLLRQEDSVGLTAFADKPLLHIPPQNSPDQFQLLLERMALIDAASNGDTGFHIPLVNAAKQMGHKGLIVLVSDMFGADSQTVATLAALSSQKHDVVIFNILSPDEIDLPFDGQIEFRDRESGAAVVCDPALLRNDYRNEVNRHLAIWKKICGKNDIEFITAVTSENPAKTLAGFLVNRIKAKV